MISDVLLQCSDWSFWMTRTYLQGSRHHVTARLTRRIAHVLGVPRPCASPDTVTRRIFITSHNAYYVRCRMVRTHDTPSSPAHPADSGPRTSASAQAAPAPVPAWPSPARMDQLSASTPYRYDGTSTSSDPSRTQHAGARMQPTWANPEPARTRYCDPCAVRLHTALPDN